MNHSEPASKSPTSPALGELLARYLDRQAQAQAEGLAAAHPTGEVLPYDAAPVQTIDPRLAWAEAQATVQPGTGGRPSAPPPEWPALVASQSPLVALPLAAANYPQMVRHLQPMLHQGPLSVLRSRPAPRVALLALLAWAETTLARRAFPDVILALGALRLANEFDRASELARAVQASVPAPWQTAFANEVAARLWHQGHVEEALAAWETLPAGPIASFNRGMATLFLDRPGDALPELTQAASELPEKSGWHHLAQLYLALARMRG